jgi:hypothetical protein
MASGGLDLFGRSGRFQPAEAGDIAAHAPIVDHGQALAGHPWRTENDPACCAWPSRRIGMSSRRRSGAVAPDIRGRRSGTPNKGEMCRNLELPEGCHSCSTRGRLRALLTCYLERRVRRIWHRSPSLLRLLLLGLPVASTCATCQRGTAPCTATFSSLRLQVSADLARSGCRWRRRWARHSVTAIDVEERSAPAVGLAS